jgi:hypothetical protein
MKLADFSLFFHQFVLISVVLKVFYNHYKKIVAFRDDTIVSFIIFNHFSTKSRYCLNLL